MKPAPTLLLALVLLLNGCRSTSTGPQLNSAAAIEAHRTTAPLQIDGRLDEAAWQHATPYPFHLVVSASMRSRVRELEEPGTARLLYDDRFLYLGFEFQDADVEDYSKADGQKLYTLSDVAEIFLKPADQTWYWELHLTPGGRVTTYFWPGRGLVGLPLADGGPLVRPRFVQVATRVNGTLNNWRDRDQGWTAEVAVPIEKLDPEGSLKTLGPNWRILLARYNFSRYRRQATGPELSSVPAISEPSFHLTEEFARLKLLE